MEMAVIWVELDGRPGAPAEDDVVTWLGRIRVIAEAHS
jgi:hypothetical protein